MKAVTDHTRIYLDFQGIHLRVRKAWHLSSALTCSPLNPSGTTVDKDSKSSNSLHEVAEDGGVTEFPAAKRIFSLSLLGRSFINPADAGARHAEPR